MVAKAGEEDVDVKVVVFNGVTTVQDALSVDQRYSYFDNVTGEDATADTSVTDVPDEFREIVGAELGAEGSTAKFVKSKYAAAEADPRGLPPLSDADAAE